TYYLRRARTTQMDTMLQHARMYGYRQRLIPYTRVFLPLSLATRFHQIQETETALRNLLAESVGGTPVPVELAQNLVSTRPNILDGRAIGAYRPGQQLYVTEPLYLEGDVGDSTERITRRLREIWNGEPELNTFREVPVETIVDLLEEVRVPEDGGDWN